MDLPIDEHIDELVEIDVRPGSAFRKEQEAIADRQYGIVSFPRSGHNWLSRMLAEIIRTHCGHEEPAVLGGRGRSGLGRYVGLKSHRPDQVAKQEEFYAPFPVVYGSHGHVQHDGYEPATKCYLYRSFWAVWKSTKKAQRDMDKQWLERRGIDSVDDLSDEAKVAMSKDRAWWGKNFLHYSAMYWRHRWTFRKAPLKVRYEDMIADPKECLYRIIHHMGVYEVDDQTIEAGVRAGSRENMRKEQELYGSPNPFETVNAAKTA